MSNKTPSLNGVVDPIKEVNNKIRISEGLLANIISNKKKIKVQYDNTHTKVAEITILLTKFKDVKDAELEAQRLTEEATRESNEAKKIMESINNLSFEANKNIKEALSILRTLYNVSHLIDNISRISEEVAENTTMALRLYSHTKQEAYDTAETAATITDLRIAKYASNLVKGKNTRNSSARASNVAANLSRLLNNLSINSKEANNFFMRSRYIRNSRKRNHTNGSRYTIRSLNRVKTS
jgi:hypothetical protein